MKKKLVGLLLCAGVLFSLFTMSTLSASAHINGFNFSLAPSQGWVADTRANPKTNAGNRVSINVTHLALIPGATFYVQVRSSNDSVGTIYLGALSITGEYVYNRDYLVRPADDTNCYIWGRTSTYWTVCSGTWSV